MPAESSRACDWEAFVERLGGDRLLAREMSRAFVSDAPRLLGELKAAVQSADLDAMRRAAHALKGAAGNFAAAETVALASKLEQTARDGDLTTALALVDRLVSATTQLVTRLRTFEGPESCAS
jgi:HPt (histidine-containing phosphotransfer) domain-containing protein